MVDLKGLIETRLRAYDPLIDLSENGTAQEMIVKPIIKAFGLDPMSTDIRTFLISKFNELYPNTTLANGDAVSDILISVGQLFFDAYRQEVNSIRQSLSIEYLEQMSDSDADALAANWLVSRRSGTRATGNIRVVVNRLASINIGTITTIRSKNDVIFFPSNFETIDVATLLANKLPNGNYFFEINVTAALAGTDGNISVGSIASISNVQGVVSVTNLNAFTGGSDTEDNYALLRDRLPRSATERSLVTKRGIVARLENYSANIKSVEVVGFGDIEMTRDVVDFDNRGRYKSFGIAYAVGRLLFVTIDNPKQQIIDGDLIQMTDGNTLEVISVVGSQNSQILLKTGVSFILYVDNDFGLNGTTFLFNLETKPEIVLGGELINSDVHLGGKVDVYIEPSSFYPVSTSFKDQVIESEAFGTSYIVISPTIIQVTDDTNGISNGMFLVLSEGVFKICKTTYNNNVCVMYISADIQDLGLINGPWSVIKNVSYNLTKAETLIKDSSAGLFATVTVNRTVFLNDDISNEIVVGDVLSLDTLGLTFTITAIFGDRLDIKENVANNIFNAPASLKRVIPNNVLPASDVLSVYAGDIKLPNSRCLGLEPTAIYGAKEISRGIGFVSRCLLDLFRSPGNLPRAQLPLLEFSKSKFKIRHVRYTKQTGVEFNLDSKFDVGGYGGGYSYLDDDMSVAIFMGNKKSMEFENADENLAIAEQFDRSFYIEVPLFNDMLIPGANNIFVALGDGTSDYNFPIENFLDGNILRIDSGINKGDYLIDKVLNIKLPVKWFDITPKSDYWRKPVHIAGNINVQFPNNENKMVNVYTITYHTKSGQSEEFLFRNISIVKIKDKFPVNPFDVLNSQLDESLILKNVSGNIFPDVEDKIGLNIFDFFRLDDVFVNQIKSTTIKTILDSDASEKVVESVVQKFKGIVGINRQLVQFDDQYLEKLYKVPYTYGAPAIGVADLYLEDAAELKLRPIMAQKYSIPDINNAMFNLISDIANANIPRIQVLKDLKNNFYAKKSNLKLVLRNEESFSVIGAGDYADKKTWLRGLNIQNVNVAPSNILPLNAGVVGNIDNVLLQNAFDILSECNDAQISVCEELFVQKRFVHTIEQNFLPFIPLYIPDQEIRQILIAMGNIGPITTGVDVLNSQFLALAEGVNADNYTAKRLVEYYTGLGTYLFMFINENTYRSDPNSIKIIPPIVDQTLGIRLPGNTPEERQAAWEDLTTFQAADLYFYKTNETDTSITGISVAYARKSSDEIRLISPIASLSNATFNFTDALLTCDAFVETPDGNTEICRVTNFEQQSGKLTLDRPMLFSTPRVVNNGRCYYDRDGSIVLYGMPGLDISTDNEFVFKSNDGLDGNESGMIIGTTSRFLTDNDVGRYITIFNYVQSPEYTGVAGEETFPVIRQHIGAYQITEISNDITRQSQFNGTTVIIKQTISTTPQIPNMYAFGGLRRLQIDEDTPIELCFAITDAPDVQPTANDDGTTNITTFLPIQFYANKPNLVDVVGVSSDNTTVAVKMLIDNSVASVNPVKPFVFKDGFNNVNLAFDKNNPFIVSTKSFLSIKNFDQVGGMYRTQIKFQSIGLDPEYNLISNEAFDTFNEEIAGYSVESIDQSFARTSKENMYIHINPKAANTDVANADVQVQSLSNFAVSIAESVFASDERVVCSDALVKEKVRSYLGADIRYYGSVSEKVVINAVISLFNNAVISSTPIVISSLIQHLHRIGVSRVVMPIKLYHIVVDLDRRVYYRPIKDILDTSVDLDIIATTRLLMTIVPEFEQTIHGAKIVATKMSDTTLIG